MNDVKNISRQDTEPTVRQDSGFLPMWLTGLLGFMIFWGFNHLSAGSGQYHELVYEPYASTNQLSSFLPKDEFQQQMKQGGKIYSDLCMNCHQPNGGGNPGQAPPLASSEWVLPTGPNRIIRIPMRGLSGNIKVKGVDWNNLSMPAVGLALSDEEVASVLTFVRNNWGNKAPRVTPEQVAKIRAEIKDHPDPFTVTELEKISEGP